MWQFIYIITPKLSKIKLFDFIIQNQNKEKLEETCILASPFRSWVSFLYI